MSPTMRRASGRSTRSSTNSSSSRIATRVSRGAALINSSRFIGLRADPRRRRLGDGGGAAQRFAAQRIVSLMRAHPHVGKWCRGTANPVDRPRRIRLKRLTQAHQQRSDRHAIDTPHEVEYWIAGERPQQRHHGRCHQAHWARKARRVATRQPSRKDNASRHVRNDTRLPCPYAITARTYWWLVAGDWWL